MNVKIIWSVQKEKYRYLGIKRLNLLPSLDSKYKLQEKIKALWKKKSQKEV